MIGEINLEDLFNFDPEPHALTAVEIPNTMYRIVDGWGLTTPHLLKFTVVNVTPKGFKILVDGKQKQVFTGRPNSFAFKTINEALRNYKHRKICQIGILNAKVQFTKDALHATESILERRPIEVVNYFKEYEVIE